MNENVKQRILHLLRVTGMLKPADLLLLLREMTRKSGSNRRFLREHADFPVPPASLAFDAYNHADWQVYHDMGRVHASLIADLIKKHVTVEKPTVCEWGCGPARVIRHLHDLLAPGGCSLVGTDNNPKSIEWCSKSIPNIAFHVNQLGPPLPLENNSLDCIYSISVFTHLSEERHYEWIEELKRVVKPGGVIIFTTHGDNYRHLLLPQEAEAYNGDKLVARGQIQEGKKSFTAFHPPAFIRQELLKGLEVLEHITDPSAYELMQDVWVVRNGVAQGGPDDERYV